MQYVDMSEQVLEKIGGTDNINYVEHCATRLRIHYNKKSKIDLKAIEGIDKVVGVIDKSGQIQIIIGPNVHEAYTDFIDVSGFTGDNDSNVDAGDEAEEPENKNFMYYLNKFGNFCAAIFMPIVPALITGGLILSIKNLLVNYMGFSTNSGTAQILLAIFSAGFSFLPIWVGYQLANKLKLEPIMGGFLGAVLVSSSISGVKGLDFFGIPVPTVSYESSIIPVVLGIILMYWVNKLLVRIIPEMFIYFLKPLLTMVIVVPITLIILGPIGTELSTAVGNGIVKMMDVAGAVALPILSALYPYMVMLGLDKALTPIMTQAIASVGYDPFNMVMGLVSNLCIGGSALAVATSIRGDKGKRGMFASFGVTALCGVTEPAFYGSLIMRPKCLIGTAIGAVSAGLVAGIFGLKNYVVGGCPGLLTALYFVPENGNMGNVILYFVVSAIAIVVSFVATKVILIRSSNTSPEIETDKVAA